MKHRVITTADGSKTLYIPEMDEQYHSVNGALTESDHVFLKNGYLHQNCNPVSVFEVGFGTGLNALLTNLKADEQKRHTIYTSIEKYPVEEPELQQLGYGQLFSEPASALFEKIHTAPWNTKVKITEYFTLNKVKADLTEFTFEETESIDVVYFDAFAPDKQPKLWTPEIFNHISGACRQGAVFVTYSAKGVIRRQLISSGFEVERLPGPPGKRQMLRGTRI